MYWSFWTVIKTGVLLSSDEFHADDPQRQRHTIMRIIHFKIKLAKNIYT
jgi:hypothetical protein